MRRRRTLSDLYNFPVCKPKKTTHGVYGDPDACAGLGTAPRELLEEMREIRSSEENAGLRSATC